MLKQQLTALACVIGIIALGACSYGSPAAAPPPPVSIAPTIDLLHLHSIRIAATNASSPPHLLPNELALAFANAWRAKHTGVAVHDDTEVNSRDALFAISVVSERLASRPPSGKVLYYSSPTIVSLTATLTSQTGDILWHENAYQNLTYCPMPSTEVPDAPADPWQDPGFRACVTNSVALQLADRLFHSLGVPR